MTSATPVDRDSAGRGIIVAQHLAADIAINAAERSPQWDRSSAISFCANWQGVNPKPDRQTQVRVLWSNQTVYIRFDCHYQQLNVFDDADADRRRDKLWERDVAEAFLQPDASRERYYREFEVSPNGMWIDLDVFPGGIANLQSGMKSSVALNERARTWAAELAIPMRALTQHFDPMHDWRANFYRVEGRQEPRSYLAWQPTGTPAPNFHVPAAFGIMRFQL